MAKYMAWATITETHKFFFEAANDEYAQGLIDMVNEGDLNLDDLHNGNYSIKRLDVECDSPERIDEQMIEHLEETKKLIGGDNYTIISREDLDDRLIYIVGEFSVWDVTYYQCHGTFSSIEAALTHQAKVHQEEDNYVNSFDTKEELV